MKKILLDFKYSARKSSFDNQCVECDFKNNPTHSSKRGDDGINRASKSTPVRCLNCDSLLPRPWVEESGKYRIIEGIYQCI